MEFNKLLEGVFKEAYRRGKQDAIEGIHVDPKLVFEQFLASLEQQQDEIELLVNRLNNRIAVKEVDLH